MSKKLLLLMLIALAALCLVACGGGGEEPAAPEGAAQSGGEPAADTEKDTSLVVTVTTEILTLDPQMSGGAAAETLGYQIFDRLVYADEFNNVYPQLATDWEQSEDNLEWTFHLRQGVKFHDGEDFTAADVKNTLARYKSNSATRSYLYSNIKDVVAVDDYTVKIITETPQANLLNTLAYGGGAIMSSKSLQRTDDEIAKEPVGAGPYKLKELGGTEYVVLERYEDYWGGLPDATEIKFIYVSEVSTRVNMLLAGEADFITGLTAQDLQQFENNDKFTVKYADSNRVAHIGFNTLKAPFDNVLVRQAMNYAVDKEALVEGVMSGLATVAKSVVAETTWGFCDYGDMYAYDPDKAKELLAEAGYPDGFSAKVITPDGRYFKDKETVMAVVSQLQAVGINLDVEVIDWASYLTKVKVAPEAGNDVELYFFGWESSTGEAVYLENLLFTEKNWAPTGWNTMFYANEEFEQIHDLAATCLDDDQRMDYLAQTQKILMEDAPWMPLYVYKQVAVYRSDLDNITLLPIESPRFTAVTIK